MARLFISHSSANVAEAVAIRDWLATEGWDDVFLDLDPERGIKAGERWERALNEAASRCEAVLFLVSRAWLDSRWCLREFNLAHRLNKRLFAAIIEALPLGELPEDLTGQWQVADLAGGQDHIMFQVSLPRTHAEAHVTFSREGLARLKGGLTKAGLDPRFFAWPPPGEPNRPPYRGLKPLEAEDAGIFFGRDAPVVEALDKLRGLREAAAPRLLVVLGASGSGKSSFLRAGLLPRLARDDRNFLPLPLIRPERAAISGETGLVTALDAALSTPEANYSRAAIRSAVAGGADGVRPLLQRLVDAAFTRTLADESDAPRPAVVLAIDQAEELFQADGLAEGEALLDLVRGLVLAYPPAVIALVAIRSDAYDRLETAKALEGLRQETFPLLPMPRGAYQTVIESPAARLADTGRRLAIEPRLTQRLFEDIEKCGGSDALPLLAFTLEQLYVEYGRAGGALRLTDYEDFGGIGGSIEAAVGRALIAADGDPRIPRDPDARLLLVRRGLIPWLAGIDPETGSPRRRIARYDDVPEESQPLIDLLVEQRLLVTDRNAVTREVTIEPAHESLLRQWGLLKGWLEEDFAALMTLEAVKRAARDWAANARAADWLNHAGGRLEDAEHIAARPDFAGDLSEDSRDYLRECRTREQATQREKEEALAREEVRLAEIAAAQRRTTRLQQIRTWALAAIALLVAIGTGAVLWQQSRLAIRERIIAEGHDDLLGELAAFEQRSGNLDSALRLSVHGARLDSKIDRGAARPSLAGAQLAAGVSASAWRRVLNIQEPYGLTSGAYSPNGSRIITTSVTPVSDAGQNGMAQIWDAETGEKIATLSGYVMFSAKYSPDGSRILTTAIGSGYKTARERAQIWDAATAKELFELHTGPIASAAFSPDGTRIVTASEDKTVRIWDAVSGKEIKILRDDYGVDYAGFSPNGSRIVTVSNEVSLNGETANRVLIWDAASGTEITTLRGHKGRVNSAAFSPDGTRIVTTSDDGTARIWEAASGKVIAVLNGGEHPDAFSSNSAAFSPDGSRILTVLSKTMMVWDAVTGKKIAVLPDPGGMIRSVAFSPDGSRILAAVLEGEYDDQGVARIWDATGGKEIAVLRGHEGFIESAAYSPDGSHILTVSGDQTARIWDTGNGQEIKVLQGHEGAVMSAAYSPDGSRIVTASEDKTVRIWDAASGKKIKILRDDHGVRSAAYTSDGSRVLTASEGEGMIWDAATWQQITALHGTGQITFPGGPKIGEATVQIWDAPSRKRVAVLPGLFNYFANSAAFNRDGSRIVTVASKGDTVQIWDSASWKRVGVLPEKFAISAALSPDGSRAVTMHQDGPARIWDVASRKEIAVLCCQADAPFAAYSPDGSRIVTASADKTARIWDTASGRAIAVLRDDYGFRSAAFSPNGSRIATVSLNMNYSGDKTASNRVLIWDVASGTEITALRGHEGFIASAAFSPDASRVVTGSADKTARIWDVHFATMGMQELIVEACTRRLRGISTLSRDEMRLAGYLDTTPEIDVCAGVNEGGR